LSCGYHDSDIFLWCDLLCRCYVAGYGSGRVWQMISIHRIDEVELMIKEGRHSKARHLIRDMLADLKRHPSSDPGMVEKNSVMTGLLTDTLETLLSFYNESNISLNTLRAARFLVHPPMKDASSERDWRRIKY
jgi:hypothetical protein